MKVLGINGSHRAGKGTAALLQAACAAVQRLGPDEDGERREAAMLALYRAVFALGEDWDPEALEAVCEALETAGR